MTTDELNEIRKRNEARSGRCDQHPKRDWDSVYLCLTCDNQRADDVIALLAEVERLRDEQFATLGIIHNLASTACSGPTGAVWLQDRLRELIEPSAFSHCPWCLTPGGDAITQQICRLWSKADNDLVCASCHHEHSGDSCQDRPMDRPWCSCTMFVAPLSPCAVAMTKS